MYQLIAVLISFSIIPILIKKKLKLSFTLLITAGVLGVFSNIGLMNIFNSVLQVFLNSGPRDTVLIVMMVSVLGGLMGHYKILERIVAILEKIIRNKKNILMIIPAFIGLLIIPGGALLSAPFVDDLGKELKLPSERRAAINLIFRHIAMFILPYSTGLLIISSSLPEMSIVRIIALNSVFVGALIVVGYFLFIRDIEVEISSKRENLSKNLIELIILTSPIYLPVLMNLTIGLSFYLALLFSIAIVYILSDKKDFMKNTINSISWHTALTVVAILIMKEMILNMDGLLALFTSLFNNSQHILLTLLIFLVTSMFFGFITGNQGAALAIILPMVTQIDVSNDMLYVYIYFAYCAAFIGYFFSPLHLCQAFTIEVMQVKTGDLYREYRKYAAIMFMILIGTFFIFRTIL